MGGSLIVGVTRTVWLLGGWIGSGSVCVPSPLPFIFCFVIFIFLFFSVASVGGLGFVKVVENEWLVVCGDLGETLRINFV